MKTLKPFFIHGLTIYERIDGGDVQTICSFPELENEKDITIRNIHMIDVVKFLNGEETLS